MAATDTALEKELLEQASAVRWAFGRLDEAHAKEDREAYRRAVTEIEWRADHLLQLANSGPQHVKADLYDVATRLRDDEREVPRLLTDVAAKLSCEISADDAVCVPTVQVTPQSAVIEWNETRYPVTHAMAEAFEKMLAEEGQPVGLGGGNPLRKPSEDFASLKSKFPDLASIVEKGKGNSGYRLTVFD